MKISLTRIQLRASLGIYLAEDQIVWSIGEKTPFGKRIAETLEEPTTRAEWPEALHRILERLNKSETLKRTPVVIGLPTSHLFFATFPGSGKADTAEKLLASQHCCSAIPPAELCCDLVSIKLNGRQFASVAASRRKDLQALVDAATSLGARFVRIQPAPWALLRSAKKHKAAKTLLRMFVKGSELVAIVVDAQQPLLWRIVELADEADIAADAIVSLVRAFDTYATQHLGLSALDAIVLEGTDVPAELTQRLTGEFGSRFTLAAGPGPTPAAISQGLALGGLEWEAPTLDLARPLAPPPRLVDLIPRGETAMMGAVVICTGLWLWGSGTLATNKAQRAEEDNKRNALLRTDDDTKLKAEKTALSAEVLAVSRFITNRVMWTEYMNQLSTRLPDGVRIVSIIGDYEMTTGAEKEEKKVKKGLLIEFSTTLARDAAAPPEVDKVLSIIRATPMIARDFPEVRLNSLRLSKSADPKKSAASGGDPATFLVSCLPKSKSGSAGGAPTGGIGGGIGGGDSKSAAARIE